MNFKSKTCKCAPIIGVIGVLMLVVVSGCIGNKTTDKSSSITDSIANVFSGSTDIEDILKNPDSYIGKTVTVVGKPSGRPIMGTLPEYYRVRKVDTVRRDNTIAVETYNFPEEDLDCVSEISVTGEVYKKQVAAHFEMIIREKSHKILSVDKKLC